VATLEGFETTADGKAITVPKVEMERCDQCGETFLTPGGSERVDDYIDQVTETISQEDLQRFLDQYQLTQKQAAEVLQIGEKNFSRWINGRQRVSASMSNYIRTLLAVPEAFETLRSRQWDTAAKVINFPAEERQPDELEKTVLSETDYKQLVHIGLVEKTLKHDERRSQLCRLTGTPDLLAFQSLCYRTTGSIAAYKDTNQTYSQINGGLWVHLGERAARAMSVSPYSREKLEKAVTALRELTCHEPHTVFESVQKCLASAGVALVVIPKLEGSAFRGCTRLLHPGKAMIVHSLKYKNVSQFWRVLFHEIAHLILHIDSPDDRYDEYVDQQSSQQEQEADQWADEVLVYGEKLIAFQARHPKPTLYDLTRFADELNTSPAIVAEIINDNHGKQVFNYAHLRNERLFPSISDASANSMWSISRELISAH
jgi:HTH-type transcriptional regulator/antitoxin HigA